MHDVVKRKEKSFSLTHSHLNSIEKSWQLFLPRGYCCELYAWITHFTRHCFAERTGTHTDGYITKCILCKAKWFHGHIWRWMLSINMDCVPWLQSWKYWLNLCIKRKSWSIKNDYSRKTFFSFIFPNKKGYIWLTRSLECVLNSVIHESNFFLRQNNKIWKTDYSILVVKMH